MHSIKAGGNDPERSGGPFPIPAVFRRPAGCYHVAPLWALSGPLLRSRPSNHPPFPTLAPWPRSGLLSGPILLFPDCQPWGSPRPPTGPHNAARRAHGGDAGGNDTSDHPPNSRRQRKGPHATPPGGAPAQGRRGGDPAANSPEGPRERGRPPGGKSRHTTPREAQRGRPGGAGDRPPPDARAGHNQTAPGQRTNRAGHNTGAGRSAQQSPGYRRPDAEKAATARRRGPTGTPEERGPGESEGPRRGGRSNPPTGRGGPPDQRTKKGPSPKGFSSFCPYLDTIETPTAIQRGGRVAFSRAHLHNNYSHLG